MKTIISILFFMVASWQLYLLYDRHYSEKPPIQNTLEDSSDPRIEIAWSDPKSHKNTPSSTYSDRKKPKIATYQCDGRTKCSQMKSCSEAIYFLKNCPNVKMDGNNDGIPCEKQWCNQ